MLAEGAGGCSDHLALVRAYNGWAAAKAQGRERAYAAAYFVSGSTMNMIEGMRTQLLTELMVNHLLLLSTPSEEQHALHREPDK